MKNDEHAYLLGWLACDGCLESNEITISLQLQRRDATVVDKFCKIFGARREKDQTVAGRVYSRARLHSKAQWADLSTFYKGRLKENKKFPDDASAAFVVGCLDADGCFYVKRNSVEGVWQHASKDFRAGMEKWLKVNGVRYWLSRKRPVIGFTASGCRKLAEIYRMCPFALKRKADKLLKWPRPSEHYWTDKDLLFLKQNYRSLKTSEVASRLGRTVKSVGVMAYRKGYACAR